MTMTGARRRLPGSAIASLLAAWMLLLTPGCSLFRGGDTPSRIATLTLLAGDAAHLGTAHRLRTHPADRAKFEVAAQALTALDGSQDYDPVKFADALKALPVLNSPDGIIYVSGAVTLWRVVAKEATAIDRTEWVKPVLRAVRDGIQRGLAPAPAETTTTGRMRL